MLKSQTQNSLISAFAKPICNHNTIARLVDCQLRIIQYNLEQDYGAKQQDFINFYTFTKITGSKFATLVHKYDSDKHKSNLERKNRNIRSGKTNF